MQRNGPLLHKIYAYLVGLLEPGNLAVSGKQFTDNTSLIVAPEIDAPIHSRIQNPP